MNIYVASSWRNEHQPNVVTDLRCAGHQVFDFRHPSGDRPGGFHWSELDPAWKEWDNAAYLTHLQNNPLAAQGYMTDFRAMEAADACLLVMPCGRSAHLELGYCAGRGKRTAILLEQRATAEPELMYLLADATFTNMSQVLAWLAP